MDGANDFSGGGVLNEGVMGKNGEQEESCNLDATEDEPEKGTGFSKGEIVAKHNDDNC